MKFQIKIFAGSMLSHLQTQVNEFLANEITNLTDNPEAIKLFVTESDRSMSITIQYIAKND